MVKKRGGSPDDNDADRISENLYHMYGGSIKDEETFTIAFEDYFQGNSNDGIDGIRGDIFKQYRQRHPEVEQGSIHKKAGGKNFKRDRKKTSKIIVDDRKTYIKKGARNVDLQGYDTRTSIRKKPEKKDFSIIGKVKRQTVFARATSYTLKNGKKITQYRDKKGRFVKKL